MCDKCVDGTVGCVLKIPHTLSSLCLRLQRDYEALKMERKEVRYLSVKAVWLISPG